MGCGASKGAAVPLAHDPGPRPARGRTAQQPTPHNPTEPASNTSITQVPSLTGDSTPQASSLDTTSQPPSTQPPPASSPDSEAVAADLDGSGPQPRAVWHCAASLAFLQRFVREECAPGWTTYDILKQVVLPKTADTKCRYVDVLPSCCSSTLTYFVSYAWSMPFALLVALLEHHLAAADPEQVFCWVDVLAINQHPGQHQAQDLADLEVAVRLARGTLVCLDPACVPFSRIWCLFEWWTTLRVRGLGCLTFLADPATRRQLGQLYQTIDVRKAQATVDSDRERIMAAIGPAIDLVNAQLRLLFLLEPYDTASDRLPYGTAAGVGEDAAAAAADAAGGAGAGAEGGGGGLQGYGADAQKPQQQEQQEQGEVSWVQEPFEAWLALPPEHPQYRALLLVGPPACSKSHGAAAAIASLAQRSPARPTAVHFCRTGDAPSTDPGVMLRSLAFQLACGRAGGPLADHLRARLNGLPPESVRQLSSEGQQDAAFNVLLKNPLQEVLTPPQGVEEDPDVYVPRLPGLRTPAQQQQSGGDAGCGVHEVILLVDGVDEAEGPSGLPHDNRVLVALRELLPQLPPRVRFVFTTRTQPQHVVRSLAFSFGARTAYPPAHTQQQQLLLQGEQQQAGQQLHTTAGPGAPNHLLSVLQPLLAQLGDHHEHHHQHVPPPPGSPQQPGGGGSALDAAYLRIFTAQLKALGPTERCGVRSLLELLLASPQPPSLAVIAQQGLSPHLHHLPGWGVLFAVRAFRLKALHRSLMDWMRRALAGVGGGGVGGAAPQVGGAPAAVATRPASSGRQQRQQQQEMWDVRLGVDVDVGRGHARLADWALADLRGRARPQAYSLRYAIYHLAHAIAAGQRQEQAQGRAPGAEAHTAEYQQQLDALLLDWGFWQQVYTSRLGSAVLRDLLTLSGPALYSPAARDAVRLVRRDHAALERDPGLVANLARESPLSSATRAHAPLVPACSAVAGASALASVPAPVALAGVDGKSQGATAGGGGGCWPCVVAAPVHAEWPALLAVVSGPSRNPMHRSVRGVAYSPDGTLIALATNASTVELHDAQTGDLALRLRGHREHVHTAAFVPTPTTATAMAAATPGTQASGSAEAQAPGPMAIRPLLLVSGGSDKTVRLWDCITGEQLACVSSHPGQITAVVVHPGGQLVASACERGTVCIWRVADLLPRPGAPAAAAPPTALAAYQAGSGPASVAVPLCTLAHPDAVFGCAFAAGGTDAHVPASSDTDVPRGVLATACKDATVRFWDIGSGEQVGSLSVAAYGGPKTMASRVSYTSDGTVLVVGLSNGGVLVCTRQSPPQKQQQQAPNHHQGWAVHAHLTGHTAHVTGIALTQDGRRAYSSSTDNTIRVWDLTAALSAPCGADTTPATPGQPAPCPHQLAVLGGHQDYVDGVALAPGGGRLASASSDGTVRIWEVGGADGKAPATPQQHSQDIMAMAVASNGNRYIATASKDKTVGIWMLPDPPGVGAAIPPARPPQQPHEQQHVTTAVEAGPAVNPGRQPEAGVQEERREQREEKGQGQQQSQGQDAAAAAEAPSVGLMMQLSGHSSTLSDVAVASDEVTLASCSYDGTVRVYRLDRPTVPELVLSAGPGFVTALSFDAWGSRLVSAFGQGQLAYWDASVWEAEHFTHTHGEQQAGAEGAGAGAVGPLGEAASGTEKKQFEPLRVESDARLTAYWSLAHSPGAYLVAAGNNNNIISMWDGLQPGQEAPECMLLACYRPEEEANGHVYGVAWSPDGTRIAGAYSGRAGGRARVYDITTGMMVADFRAHDNDTWRVAFDPSGHLLATTSYDGTVCVYDLYDTRAAKRVATLRGHSGCVRGVAFARCATPAGNGSGSSASGGDGNACGEQDGGQVEAAGAVAGNGTDGVVGYEGGDVGRDLLKVLEADPLSLVTAGSDATVRVWSVAEAVRAGQVSYVCPWSLPA